MVASARRAAAPAPWKFTYQNYERLTALNGLNDATDPNLSAFARAAGIWITDLDF
jgi:hypothetical protein